MSMKSRVAIVTGGGGMIGRAAAAALARDGVDILLVDINARRLEESHAIVSKFSTRVEVCLADCGLWSGVESYVAQALKQFGRIDAFFNNAGVESKVTPIYECTEAEWDRVININLKGVFLGLRHMLPVMIAQGSGAIVNTGSIASERGLPGSAAYNAAKHGVLGLTRTSAADVGHKGVRINAVLPGFIDTPLFRTIVTEIFGPDHIEDGVKALGQSVPIGRVAQPAEVGEVVAFLLSDRASYVNGVGWAVDGGILATTGNSG